MKPKAQPIPTLESSPFAPLEAVDEQNLSAEDRATLEKEEAIIESGRKTFLSVASALMRIHDYKDGLLYLKPYGSFEKYCQERWEFGTAYALRLLDAAKVVAGISPMGENDPMPTNERQVRALSLLADADARRDAWQKAVQQAGKDGITGKTVSKVVAHMIKAGAHRRTAERKTTGSTKVSISRESVELIRKRLVGIRRLTCHFEGKEKVIAALKEIENLLPEVNPE